MLLTLIMWGGNCMWQSVNLEITYFHQWMHHCIIFIAVCCWSGCVLCWPCIFPSVAALSKVQCLHYQIVLLTLYWLITLHIHCSITSLIPHPFPFFIEIGTWVLTQLLSFFLKAFRGSSLRWVGSLFQASVPLSIKLFLVILRFVLDLMMSPGVLFLSEYLCVLTFSDSLL